MISTLKAVALKLKKHQRKTFFRARRKPVIKHLFPKKISISNSIRIEICGACNAKCLFCHSGKVPFEKNKMMSPDFFEKILLHLKDMNLLSESVFLYSRGEPFMHKEIGKILDICRDYQLNALISTNASRVPNLTRNQWKTIKFLKVSISGITEESYKLIYGLNVSQILKNVEKIAHKVTASCKLSVNWLRYTFNAKEETEARKWLESLGYFFKAQPATLIQIEKLMDLKEGRLSEKEIKDIKDYLLLDEKRNNPLRQLIFDKPNSTIKKKAANLVCSQWNHIIVHNDGELLKCCGIPTFYPENRLGKILNYTAEDIKNKKYEIDDMCNKCIKYGLTL